MRRGTWSRVIRRVGTSCVCSLLNKPTDDGTMKAGSCPKTKIPFCRVLCTVLPRERDVSAEGSDKRVTCACDNIQL